MPLADKSSDIDWLAQQEQSLASFAEKIGNCIEHSDWEQLTLTLASRQAFLERLLGGSIPEDCRNAVKQLVEAILEQDKHFQAKLEEQKTISTRLQLTLERGRRAIHAYNDHL